MGKLHDKLKAIGYGATTSKFILSDCWSSTSFAALRATLLDASPSAMRTDDAIRAARKREAAVLSEAAKATLWPPSLKKSTARTPRAATPAAW
jgi:hypothetical protein